MATPWEQAERFAKTRWPRLKRLAQNAPPTRPLEVIDSIVSAWINVVLDKIEYPAWLFLYSPRQNGLYEWADNFSEPGAGRIVHGVAKLHTIKEYGGMLFLAASVSRRLQVGAAAVVHKGNLFVFDKPWENRRPLTEAQWEQAADREIPR